MLYFLPLFLPFLSFLILLMAGPFFKFAHSTSRLVFCGLSSFIMFLNFFFSYVFFIDVRAGDFITEVGFLGFFNLFFNSFNSVFFLINDYSLTGLNYFLDYSFLFDSLTITMILVVVGVSFLVQLFSIEYMAHDLYLVRFFSFLNFFSLCMLILVTAGNFIQMFIGWEGVGVASFLLIGFWFGRSQAVKCALKAVIVNRVGDCALLLAFSLIAFCFGDLSYIGFFNLIGEGSQISNTSLLGLFDFNYFLTDFFNYKLISSFDNSFFFHKAIFLFGSRVDLLFLIGLFLIIGAFAKSAQFGLHTWLPDAMEGPTPVSALIHAATMVTAGVFLMIRCAPLFVIDVDLSSILIIIGSITAFFGASVAASQFDIKKIIAYSTCSQLGYMMVACGVSAYDLAIFHLATHACFKAGLFLCAGLIIHSLGDEQDIRKMGGLIRAMPLTYLAMFICSFCLGGLPFFSGFYSKDAIMEASLSFDLLGWFSFFVLVLAAFLTAFYSIRMFFYVFWRNYAGSRSKVFLIHETILSSIAVLVLSGSSIFLGFYFVFGNFKFFFESNAIMFSSIDTFKLFFFSFFWTNPFLDFGFSLRNDYLFSFLHGYLPFIILAFIISVLIFSFVFLFFFKQTLNSFLIESVLNKLTVNLMNGNFSFLGLFFIFRHVFNFFAKAWLFDIFVAKMARFSFLAGRVFVQRYIESGLFEYLLVLYPVRRLALVGLVLSTEGSMSGRLSIYLFNILFGSVVAIILSVLFLFFAI